MKRNHHTLLVAGLLAASTASTASPAIIMDTVQVSDAGNANDSTGYGGVGYGYHIGTHEVTNGQYTALLNATASTDTHSLYNTNMGSNADGGINQSGTSGSFSYSVKNGFEDKPVNYVSFSDAARFTNWLTSGDTESGVYDPSDSTTPRDQATFDAGGVAIASENEWYKAAYYDGTSDYYSYPTQSNGISTSDANYDNSVGGLTDVGTYADHGSHYGTFDQGGNVWERSDTIIGNEDRVLRGGAFDFSDTVLQASSRDDWADADENFERNNIGFRVSSLEPIPEPSAYAAILGCLGLSLALIRRKGRA